jgi:hypothetical protein
MTDRYDSDGEDLIPDDVEDAVATDANAVLIPFACQLHNPRRARIDLKVVEHPGDAPNVVSRKPTKRASRAWKHNDAIQRSSPLGTGAWPGMDAIRYPLCKGKAP